MADLTFNKIAGAVLATGFVIFGLQNAMSILFESSPPTKPGYAIAVQETPEEGAAPADVPPDWGTVLPTADVAAGQTITSKCQSCHVFDASGANAIGPGLYGVVGRPPGTHAGFAYSDGMKAFGAKNPIWTYDLINSFVTSPQNFIDGTKMTFVGLKQRQDRINVIAYLHTLGSTLPIPAPKPVVAAPAAASGAPASGAPAASSAAAKEAPAK